MRFIRTAALFLLPTLLAFGQEFEVASIKPSAQTAQTPISLHIDGSMVRYSALSLIRYLGMAYGLKTYQISAPDWMGSERWDIIAKLPDGSDPKQVPKMMQALLRNRFQMKVHRETKELPVYGLVIGNRGLNLKESLEPAALTESSGQSVNVSVTGGSLTVTYGEGSYRTIGNNKFEGKKLTMAIIAETLAQYADRPVMDMTGLKGNYDFTMEFAPEDFRFLVLRASIANGAVLAPDDLRLVDAAPTDTLFAAVEKLGLKLEPRKAPIEMLVIDAALRTPTQN